MRRILLAEQNNIMKIRMEKMLQNIGYNKLLTYEGAVLNFEQYYRLTEKVNLVIINRDQFKSELEHMLNCINAYISEEDFKLIIVTSEINHNEVINLYSKGVDEIILKPFSDEELAMKITKCIHRENKERNFDVKKKTMDKARILKWCSEFEIGVENIDIKNKDFIEHFEKLYELMKTGRGQIGRAHV